MSYNSTEDNDERGSIPTFRLPDIDKISVNKIIKKKAQEPDFIPYDEQGREFWGRVTFNTGVAWALGFGVGGVRGAVESVREVSNTTFRIKLNAVMNGVSKTGSAAGNALGVVACLVTGFSALADELQLAEIAQTHYVKPAFAGFCTGLLYKSTSGPRGAALAGTIGAAATCAFSIAYGQLRSSFFRKGRY